jgi:hypothetical protein
MEMSDFQRRLLGFPAQAFGGVIPDPNAPVEQQDMANARMDSLGQMGALLLAAGQRQTPQNRAAILARMAGVDSPDTLAMTAAQRRMMQMRGQQAQTEMQRQQMLRDQLNDTKTLQSLGISAEQAQYLGDEGIRKLLENQALQNTPEAKLDRDYKQAQIDHLRQPVKASDPYSDTVARERAQFDARMEQGQKLGLQGDDLTQFASTGKIQTANEKQTQDQANAALFSSRMAASEKIISDPNIYQYGMGAKGAMNRANDAIPLIGHAFTDPQYQQFDQAQRDFINAALRRESGAAISAGEFDNARKQYFPQIGDSPEVLAQKQANRALAIRGIYEASAPQYRRTHPLDVGAPQAATAHSLPQGVRSIEEVR